MKVKGGVDFLYISLSFYTGEKTPAQSSQERVVITLRFARWSLYRSEESSALNRLGESR